MKKQSTRRDGESGDAVGGHLTGKDPPVSPFPREARGEA